MSEKQQEGKENTAATAPSGGDRARVQVGNAVADLFREIDEFVKEIDERSAKEMDMANHSYIEQGKYAVRTEILINSLHNNAFQMTSLFSSSMEMVEQTAADLVKRKNISKLKKLIAGLKCNIDDGMKAISSFNDLWVKGKELCIRLKQWCDNLALDIEANKLQGLSISGLTVREMGLIIAVVFGITAIVLGTLHFSDISSIFEVSVVVVVIAGVIAFVIAKRIAIERRNKAVYSKTVKYLKATKDNALFLQEILVKFKEAERESNVTLLANDILGLTNQYDAQLQAADPKDTTASDEFVSSLSSKCEELKEAVAMYKTKVAKPIELLDQLAQLDKPLLNATVPDKDHDKSSDDPDDDKLYLLRLSSLCKKLQAEADKVAKPIQKL